MSSHGGKREGSGRKKPASPYGVKTTPVRIPSSALASVLSYLEGFKKTSLGASDNLTSNASDNLTSNLFKVDENPSFVPLPLYSGIVGAGQSRFPSPAQDFANKKVDLNKYLIGNPPATYLYKVGKSYDSMIDVGIQPGAMLVVDKSINPKSSHIVLAIVDGEFIVKRLYKRRDVIELRSENQEKNYPPITFKEGSELVIWGVVTFNVNSL